MNFKKALLAIPLSASLLVPSGLAFADYSQPAMPTVETPAVELRADLDRMFSEHAYLAITTMRKAANGEEDFKAVSEALKGNTEDLTNAIASVYGEEAGQKFNDLWSSHIGYFVDYVKATAAGDEEAKQAALDELDQYRQDFSTFISGATEGAIPAEALASGLQTHVNQLITAFDAYVAEDYDKAFMTQSDAMEHLFMTSKGLSKAIVNQFPEKFENTKAVTNAANLRSDLNFLLSEHFALAQQAMQNGIDGDPEFKANVSVLTQNTEELSQAIASVYGEESGQQFKAFWSEHIGYFVDYVNATANNDEAAKEEALNNLDDYRKNFSEFMATATEGGVPADGLAAALQTHVNQLIGAFDSYVAEDYTETWNTAREGYAHMYGAAKLFSSAIVTQFPEKFAGMPEMPETGMGGMSDNGSMNWVLWGLPLLLLTSLFVVRKRTASQQ
ncbi:copper amine oxidase [Halobacillus amylolyticus]|uniref:Copper amine oxidase n=1 Tax=Halobacillus amylolyticus TaxID=2932259 RepID=A0ABY4HFM7_9BACI|nr:copper amine oxidase [Halobacillus amylolyticus]UOR13457.1 copper amine oxidase [Halobacillus amylolyticus]